MQERIAIAVLLGALGVAHADPAKSGDKKKAAPAPAPAPVIKTPPLPPELDNTMFADVTAAKWAPVVSLPKGAQGALIGTDPNNGGMAGWLKLPAGYRLPAAWETHITSFTVISGQVTLTANGQKHPLGAGSYAVLTSKDKHELTCGPAECLVIVHHMGPPDMHWVNPADAPKAGK
jgi:hypothetical protein